MRILVIILTVLFGLLHIIAAQTQLRSTNSAAKGSAIAMLCGGIYTVAQAVSHLSERNIAWIDAPFVAVGCLLICAAAYENGRRTGKANPLHHIIRGAIAVLLVVGFVIW